MVYRDKSGQASTLDYREKAPGKATEKMYLDSAGNVRAGGLSLGGHLASGVPGSVAGMVQAHQKFGKLLWAQVLQPAIDLAEKGFPLTERDATGLNRIKDDLLKYNPGKTYFHAPRGPTPGKKAINSCRPIWATPCAGFRRRGELVFTVAKRPGWWPPKCSGAADHHRGRSGKLPGYLARADSSATTKITM